MPEPGREAYPEHWAKSRARAGRPAAAGRYAFGVTCVGDGIELTVTDREAKAGLIVLAFSTRGRVTVKVTGTPEPFQHAAPAPGRIPRRG